MEIELEIFDDADTLAAGVSEGLVRRISELQRESNTKIVSVCLTGGTIASKVHELLGAELADGPVDPYRIALWWGDERFVPTGSEDRNAEPAISALTPAGLDQALVHPMPSSDGVDLDGAAQAYAAELGDTVFDICLLGIGPDGHVASLFPDHPSLAAGGEDAADRVIAVRDSPKPPPERISLTLPVINASQQVWLVAAGQGKAEAVAKAYRQDPSVPAGRVHGNEATWYWLDRAAAADLD